MYAVLQSGGKQHRVAPGDIIKVERLPGENGAKVKLSDVLLINDGKKMQVGKPFLDKAEVSATILEQKRDRKIIVFKKKRRQGYRRTHGHRQHLTVLQITGIQGDGVSAKADAKSIAKPVAPQNIEAPAAKEAAPKTAPAPQKAAPKAETAKAAATKAPAKATAAKKTDAKAPTTTSKPKAKS